MTKITFYTLLIISITFLACGKRKKINNDIFKEPVITVTPHDVNHAYPKPKNKNSKLYISSYSTDIRHRKLATVDILSTFSTDKDKILELIILEAKKIGADGIINIKYKAGKKIVSDFLTINRNLRLPIKIYDKMMITSADIILFVEEK